MNIFDENISQVRSFIKSESHQASECHSDNVSSWHGEKKRNVILKKDVAFELGNPETESASFLLMTEELSLINNGQITIVGPELSKCDNTSIPFGKIVLCGTDKINEENIYETYQQLDLIRYDLLLEGYMMRGVSQNLQEWNRISNEAMSKGFSLQILGKELIELYKKNPMIYSVEIIFLTSSIQDIQKMRLIGEGFYRYIMAMRKMIEEIDLDCDACDYIDICGDAGELRSMRKKIG